MILLAGTRGLVRRVKDHPESLYKHSDGAGQRIFSHMGGHTFGPSVAHIQSDKDNAAARARTGTCASVLKHNFTFALPPKYLDPCLPIGRALTRSARPAVFRSARTRIVAG